MDIADIFLSTGYITLGLIAILLGKFLPNHFLVPKKSKYKVLDEKGYVRSCRLLLYSMGVYYIVLGITLMFIKHESSFSIYFQIILIFFIYIPLFFIWKKHLRPVNKAGG